MTEHTIETEVALVKQSVDLHRDAHDREHALTKEALDKAERNMDQRLSGMNEFRRQLDTQSGTFITREAHETALDSLQEKFDTAMRSVLNRHDSDFNTLNTGIQTERELRKGFEGSVNTWKWIAGFLGASGVAGVIALFITR